MSEAVRELRAASGCSRPIRLSGQQAHVDRTTGEVLSVASGWQNPSGVLLVACGDRRAVRCPACAHTYQGDAYHLVAAGLRGGKGVPADVSEHPAVLLTLTAPSFGRVHTIRDGDGRCHCGQRHAVGDEVLGTPLDPTAYRYREQAVWNHLAPRLWKRTAQTIRRRLAVELGVSRRRLGEYVIVRFVKASEFQRRGVVHYHVVIRLDGPGDPPTAPPGRCTAALLERLVRRVVPAASAQLGDHSIRWGDQTDILRLDPATSRKAAGYIAKYSTKATEVAAGGHLVLPLRRHADLRRLDVPEHARRLVEAAWEVGGEAELRSARRWAHQFGHGGHVLTKSPGYSLTLGELRAARCSWRRQHDATRLANLVRVGRLVYAGQGYTTDVSALLDGANEPAPSSSRAR